MTHSTIGRLQELFCDEPSTLPGSQGSKHTLGSSALKSPRDFTFTRQIIVAEDLLPNKPGEWTSDKGIELLE